MTERHIVALTHRDDPHVGPVAAALERRGHELIRLDTDRQDEDTAVRTAVGPDGLNSRIEFADREPLEAETIATIWNRRNLRPFLLGHGEDREARQFAQDQFWFALSGALSASEAQWLNVPERNTAANLKLVQLDRATRFGLQVPKSIVTRQLDDLRDFASEVGSSTLLAKVVSPGTPIVEVTDQQYMVFAQAVDVANVDGEQLSAAPVLFQELVPKKLEYRVTVVGDQILACSIDSQADTEAAIDWRRVDPNDLVHQIVELEPTLASCLLQLVRSFGLRFAAIDLIERPDGSFVFLELNPNGQWLWVEELSGLPISDAIAHELAP